VFDAPVAEDIAVAISAIPGARLRGRVGVARVVEVAVHGAWIVERLIRDHGVRGVTLSVPPMAPPPTWDVVVSKLKERNEVKEWVYDFTTPYQRDAVLKGSVLDGFHVWHSAGAGKTLTLILLLLLAVPPPHPVAVVTKAAVRGQWAKEVERFTGLIPFVLKPGAERRRKDRFPDLPTYDAWARSKGMRPFIIVGWESLPVWKDALIALPVIGIGLDEAHHVKSAKRRSSIIKPDGTREYRDLDNVVTAAAKVCRRALCRYATTATPVKDRVRDLWGQLDIVGGAWSWGASLTWCKRYAGAAPNPFGGWDTKGTSNLDELVGRLSFVSHKVPYSETHRHLPAKRRESRYLSLVEQNATSKGFTAELKAAAKLGDGALVECRLSESASRKRHAVVGMVIEAIESSQKVIVFTGRHADCDLLGDAVRKALAKSKSDAGLWVAHGGNTSTTKREEIREAYMTHPGPAALIGTRDAWGSGFNLHDTDLLIFVQLPWTGGDLHQNEQRVARLGQRRPVTIRYVICEGTIDEVVASRLISKLPAMEKVAGDSETALAAAALGGIEDREKVAASIIAKLDAVDTDELDLDDDWEPE
jgi:hypothetical protein